MGKLFYKAFLMILAGFTISLAHAMDPELTWRTSAENHLKELYSSSMTCYPLDSKTSNLKNFTLRLKKGEHYKYVLTYIFKHEFKVYTINFDLNNLNNKNEKGEIDEIIKLLKEVSNNTVPDHIFSELANHFYFPESEYYTGCNLFRVNS